VLADVVADESPDRHRGEEDREAAGGQGVAVAGFDDAPPAPWSCPALTTVHQPHYDKGRFAAERLLEPAQRSGAILPHAHDPRIDRSCRSTALKRRHDTEAARGTGARPERWCGEF
jgi:hypothetical protein